MQERTLCAMLSPGPPRASRTRCAPTALRRVLWGRLQPRCHAPSPLPQGGRGCPKGGRGSAFMPSVSASPQAGRTASVRRACSRTGTGFRVMQERTLCAMLLPGPPRASRTRCAPTGPRRALREPLQPRCHALSPLPQGGRGCPKGGRGAAFMPSPSASPSSRKDGERSPRLQPHRRGISRDVGAHPVRDAVARPTKSIAHKVRSYGSAPGVATFFARPAPSRSRHVNLSPGVNKTPRGVRAGHGLAVAAGFARWHTVCIRGDAP